MLKNIKPEYYNLAHLVLLVPALVYAGYRGSKLTRDDRELWFFRFLFVLAALVLLYDGWMFWQKFNANNLLDDEEDESEKEPPPKK